MFQLENQDKGCVKNDFLRRSKHHISTGCHSRLEFILIFSTQIDDKELLRLDLNITNCDLPHRNTHERDTLSKSIFVVAVVRQVACHRESNRKVTMSTVTILLLKLRKTLHTITEKMERNLKN